MNKIFTKFAIVASAAAISLGNTGCTDLLDQAPIDYPGAGSFWRSQTEFTSNIYAMSNMFRGNYAANILFWAGELRSGVFNINLINGSGAVNVDPIQNNYDAAHSQFSTFGGYYGFIANLNELIYQCDNASEDVLDTNVKEGLLGIAYGWRAYCYFQMYRMYGGVPLRLTPDVQLGETDPITLRQPRATAEETLTQIKKDIEESLKYFETSTWTFDKATSKYYWSKAATEMLAGEVYLWSGKVATADHEANPQDVSKAKQYFENVVNNYGFRMLDDYFSIWTTPQNSETIYSICYSSTDDQVQSNGYQGQLLWSKAAGGGTNAWSMQDASGLGLRTDGAVSRFQYFTSSPTDTPVEYTEWDKMNPSPNRYMYYNAVYFQFDDQDIRKTMFFPQWVIKDEEKNLQYIANFDPKDHTLFGTFVLKFKPSFIETWSATSYVWNNDQAIYRLPLAYMYLAEIANYEGNNADVEKYINIVRKRAFGNNWNAEIHGYKAGSFRENENAILREKDKEFIMEGQRWWDLRRLTSVKGGKQTDHFVFTAESCPGFGLDPVANPWMVNGDGQTIATTTPVLTTAEEHKLLWPINQTLLDSDDTIVQNPVY